MPITTHSEPAEFLQERLGAVYRPTNGQVFAAAASEGLHYTTPSLIADLWSMRDKRAGDMGAMDNWFEMGTEERKEANYLTRDQWVNSPHYREGLQWHDGMTEEQASVLADRADQRRANEYVLARSEGQWIPKIAGSLLGSLPDPLNFIPYLGGAARTAMAARFGRIGATVLAGAAEAGLAEATIQPLIAARAKEFQEDYDAEMAVQNISMALGIGAGFGGITGAIWRVPEAKRVLAHRKTVVDVLNRDPVDVGEIIGERIPAENVVRDAEAGTPSPDWMVYLRNQFDGDLSDAEIAQRTLEVLRKPGFARTAEERMFVERFDVTPETSRALEIMNIPGFRRSAEDMAFLRDFMAGKESGMIETRLNKAQKSLDDIEGRIAEREAEGKALPKNLVDQRAALQKEVAYARTRMEELRTRRPVRNDVASQPEPEPIPDVEPTTRENLETIEEIDEMDVASIERRYNELEEQNRVTEDERRELQQADELVARSEKYSDAYRDAAVCLTNQAA